MSNAVETSETFVTITSNKLKYDTDSGSWNITSSATWIDKNNITLNINIKTMAKTDYDYIDTVLVVDNSESMEYENWENAQIACNTLIEDVYSNSKNRMSLILFNSTANIKQNLTTDKAAIKNEIDNLSFQSGTNYYQAFKKIE